MCVWSLIKVHAARVWPALSTDRWIAPVAPGCQCWIPVISLLLTLNLWRASGLNRSRWGRSAPAPCLQVKVSLVSRVTLPGAAPTPTLSRPPSPRQAWALLSLWRALFKKPRCASIIIQHGQLQMRAQVREVCKKQTNNALGKKGRRGRGLWKIKIRWVKRSERGASARGTRWMKVVGPGRENSELLLVALRSFVDVFVFRRRKAFLEGRDARGWAPACGRKGCHIYLFINNTVRFQLNLVTAPSDDKHAPCWLANSLFNLVHGSRIWQFFGEYNTSQEVVGWEMG